MLKTFVIAIYALFVVGILSADELSFDQDCKKFMNTNSQVSQYQSETCPDISVLNSCAYHTGLNFSSFPADLDVKTRVDLVMSFYNETVRACDTNCQGQDLGACVILGKTIPPFNSLDNGSQAYLRLDYLQKACLGGVMEACADAGFETDKIWDVLASSESECPEPKFFTADKTCASEDSLFGYIISHNITIASPAKYYERGCELQSGTACRMLLGFYLKYPQEDFEPQTIVDRVCEFGTSIECKGVEMLLRKFS